MILQTIILIATVALQAHAHIAILVNNVGSGSECDPDLFPDGNCNQLASGIPIVNRVNLPTCPIQCCRSYCDVANCTACPAAAPCPTTCQSDPWSPQTMQRRCFLSDGPGCDQNSCTPRADCQPSCGSILIAGRHVNFCEVPNPFGMGMGMNMGADK